MSEFGNFLHGLGVALGDAGFRWKCANCGETSRDYTGNLFDGDARCPNCGMNPVIPGHRPTDDEPSSPPTVSRYESVPERRRYDVSSSASVSAIPPEQPLYTEDYKSEIIKKHKPKPDPAVNIHPLMGMVKLILLTCNENEKLAVYEKMNPPIVGSSRSPLKRALYVPQHDLVIGIFAGYTVAVLTTEQGKKADIPLKTALDLFQNAEAIIAVGVGYGKSDNSIKFADVMVSDHIENASQVSMVGTNDQDTHVEARGGRLPIKNELLRYFKYASDWYHENGFQVSKEGRKSQAKVGTIVSCETLVRAISLRDEYMSLMAKSVGGEMEGCSLLNMIEWMEQERRPLSVIVIKGVADYGDNRKDKRWQLTAAKAAVDFVYYCLEQTGGMGRFLPGTK